MSEIADPGTEPETAVADLIHAAGLLLRRLRSESNTSELTWSQAAILGRLDEAGWTTTAELARAEAVKPQSMGTALVLLEQEGFVQRKPHPTDGRQVLFGLTERGIATRRRKAHLKREWLSKAMAELTPAERRTLAAAAALIEQIASS